MRRDLGLVSDMAGDYSPWGGMASQVPRLLRRRRGSHRRLGGQGSMKRMHRRRSGGHSVMAAGDLAVATVQAKLDEEQVFPERLLAREVAVPPSGRDLSAPSRETAHYH